MMIINNIETLKQHIATIVGDNIDRYQPYIATAEKFMKREITGTELFNLATVAHAEFLKLCQAVVAHKAYLDAIPFLDLVETESGFAVTHNQNLTPASTKRVKDLIDATALRLTECIEDLLEYLETSDTVLIDAWKGSVTYTLVNDNYIDSIRMFRNYADFAGTRMDWIAFRNKLSRARKLKIEPVISSELSAVIIEDMRDGDLTPAHDKIIDDLRFAIAAYATGDTENADSFISRVKSVLYTTPDDYPVFKASSIYVQYLAQLPRDTSADPFMTCGV
jgi:hypothetical protein